MKILLLDTSSEKSFLLLSDDWLPVAYLPLPSGPELSKTIALKLKNLLAAHAFAPEGIAVGQGPGSYTGVRVGAALAKSLAFGWDIPLIGICSLQFFTPEDPSPSLILFDARIGGFYGLEVNANSRNAPHRIALEELKNIPPTLRLCSPHPALIQKRISLPNPWVEAEPNIGWAIREAHTRLKENRSSPLTLDFLD